ncbi:MAG: hypothetical protein JSS69_10650 [Acidobacteria bacterium]|nr:hypothetical protein [Acidobacteriota bacterium]MBS1866361.1 hypothetical protein [Acidobacteriota bacterium]
MQDNDSRRSRSLVFPIILVLVGGIFLYRAFVPGFEPLPVIWKWWPLILILVGLGKMWDATQGARGAGKSSAYIGSTVGVLIFVVVLVVLFWRNPSFSHGRHGRQLDHISEVRDLQGITSLNAVVAMPAGELNISGGTSHAVESEFDYSSAWSRPTVDYTVTNKSAELNINQDNHGPSLGPEDNTWWIRLNDAVPLDLQIKMGAGQGNLKFHDLNLKQLRIDIGAGQMNVDLTGERSADLDVEIHGGVGQAKIRLPKNVGVTVDAKGGIGAVTTSGLKKQDGNYVNDAFGHSLHTIHLQVAGGIGNIDLSVEP